MNLSDTLVYNQANNIYFSTRDTIFISSLTEDYIYIVLVISAFEVYNKKHKSVFNKKHYRAPIIQPITDPLFSQPIILLISKYVLRPCVKQEGDWSGIGIHVIGPGVRGMDSDRRSVDTEITSE